MDKFDVTSTMGDMEAQNMKLKNSLPFSLAKFHISEDYGFLLPDPLKELSHYYMPWMEIANNLPLMIESHQLRVRVDKMPLLSCHLLKGHREQYLAHLLLSFITMGYVWQEGEKNIPKVLPRNLALPFVEVSQTLGIPPILVHSDFVLSNWKKKDPDGNLDIIVSLPGGESLKGFILVTLLVEKAAVPGIKALTQAINAVLQSSEEELLQALKQLRTSIVEMIKALRQMHAAFLHRMREYMPPSHRAFIEEIHSAPSLREYILSSGSYLLRETYNQCVMALAELRSYHINIVAKYVLTGATKAKDGGLSSLPGPPQALEERGTGGTAVFNFLKSVRDTTMEGIIKQCD
ncbi:indoleamine 2,3-dioxygenase 2 isoform X7 [Sminthopsis crassicaudata]|uniref:indoleamine 2,3-dioxygenase 2 isoform X7 n=1 Tax=Sminthopsis crassicaudata TaxID=9301 RepID=UPI003D690363